MTAKVAAVPTRVTETTSARYNAQCMPTEVIADDGMTTEFLYYSGVVTKDDKSRSNQVPDVSTLLVGLTLADGTSLNDAAALICPVIMDPWQPPLLAQYQYLRFSTSSKSTPTLSLFGYAQTTQDANGKPVPDTVLVLEGVTATHITGGWKIDRCASVAALKVTLVQTARNTVKNALHSIIRTSTTWYKDDSARSTQVTTEAMYAGIQAGTLRALTTAPLNTQAGATTEVILSQQIVSAYTGRLLRESQQNGDGEAVRFTCHEYDTRGRGLRSTTYAYDEAAFNSGDVSKLKAIDDQQVTYQDTDVGTWVSVSAPDGRWQRTLYDGLQRAVRRELQRVAGPDHSAGNYVPLQQTRWGAGEQPDQNHVYDYLPGGLCTIDSGEVSAPQAVKDWFWQAEGSSLSHDDKKGTQTLTSETVLGLFSGGIQFTQQRRQVNHASGGVSLLNTRWTGKDKPADAKLLRTEQELNARGQLTSLTQHIPAADGKTKSRSWSMQWDDLDRQTSLTRPDESVVSWTYQGLSTEPVAVSVTPKSGSAKVLGRQTLAGAGNAGDTVTALGRGAKGQNYSLRQGKIEQPDGTTLHSAQDDGGTSWYAQAKGAQKPTLLMSFKYNAVTRAVRNERLPAGDQQGRVTSQSLTPLLLGGWRFERTVHALKQRQQLLVSLRGNLLQAQHADGQGSQAWHNAQGHRSRVRRGSLEYWYEYTATGRCASTTVQDLHTGRRMAVSYQHDEFGQETERAYRLDDSAKVRYVQTWSALGQLLSKTLYRDGSKTASRTETFTYNTSVTGKGDELHKWAVVATAGNEIKDAAGHALTEQSYSYDTLGNLTECRSVRSSGDTEVMSYAYTNDDLPTLRTSVTQQLLPAKGNPGAKKVSALHYDDNGNLSTNEQGHTLAYSETGRLRSVTKKGESQPLTYYEYDESDRLICQWDSANQQRRILTYSGEQRCAETWQDKDGKILKTRTLDEEAGLVVWHGPTGSETQLFTLGDPQNGGGDEYWVDASGVWQHRSVAFTPWGEAPLANLNALHSGLGYNGQRVDPVTGSYHLGNGYRVYDPGHRAFYQADSWSPFGAGGLNDRAYCGAGDPVNWHDPSGHIMLSRRAQADSLARLDQMIHDTTPPTHEAASWWQWVLLGVFAVIAIAATIVSLGSAGPVMAGIGMMLCTTIMVGTAVTAAGMAKRQSNPRLASRLEGAGHIVAGVASLPGMAAGLSVAMRAVLVASTLVALSLKATKMALQQSNPELAEKLGWGATVANAVGFLSALPSLGRAAIGGLRQVRSALKTRFANKLGGLEQPRLAFFNSLHQNVVVQGRNGRATTWYHEVVAAPKGKQMHLWGADTEIIGHQVKKPMMDIARRGSTSSVTAESGVHGSPDGDNWSGIGALGAIRNPQFGEAKFFVADTADFDYARGTYTKFGNLPWNRTKQFFSKTDVAAYNAENGTSFDWKALNENMYGRNVHVVDINTKTDTFLNRLESRAGHYINAFCFGRNDERWLSRYGLSSVTSYI